MTLKGKAVVAVCGVVLANVLSVYASGFPFLYCWLGPVFRYVYLQWGTIGIYIIVVYFCYQMWKGAMIEAFFALMVVVAILELPRICDNIFRVGGSCGA